MADQTKYYPFITKDGARGAFKTVSTDTYNSSLYGDIASGSYPYNSSIAAKYFYAGSDRLELHSLKNTLNRNGIYSQHYVFSSSLGDKAEQAINLVSIPSIIYGSSIEKGSVVLSFYVTGTLIGKLEDKYKRGELVETTGSNIGSVAGVVLYNEGFILLTGSWNLDNSFSETYIYNPDGSTTSANPKWIYWGAGLGLTSSATNSSSFDLEFNGTENVQVLTMFAHASKGELNHSNNPTYIKYENFVSPFSSSNIYKEKDDMEIKNTTKYAFENYTGSLEKQTYISKIGIYDENKNLIAVAKLAKPVRKTDNRDLTFKLKLDI
jgi:hypothetical protein